MSMSVNRRAIGLAVSMVALLLLAACTGAVSTEQVSEMPATETPSNPAEAAPTDTVVPDDASAPTAAPVPADTSTPAEPATPTDTPAPTESSANTTRDYQIVTLLPRDAIPAIDRPEFYSVSEADEEYDPEELVLGVELDGEAKAYSVGLLSGHEIVNDMVAGQPISVTW